MACIIELESPGPFSPGNRIIGNVILMIHNRREHIEGITCKLRGQESTKFEIRNQQGNNEYFGNQLFLTDELVLADARSIDIGTYKYPFSFKLPSSGLPSSYNTDFGRIWYSVEAQVARSLGQSYQSDSKFVVSVPKDHNEIVQNAQMVPITYEIEETTQGCCCCMAAHITMNMTLEKELFWPGEIIRVKLRMVNPTLVYSQQTAIALLSHTQYTATNPTRKTYEDTQVLCRLTDTGIIERERTYSFEIPIPQYVFVPCLTNCILIRQWFTVTATANLAPCYDNVELPVKINIEANSPKQNGLPQIHQIGIIPPSSRNVVPVAQAPKDCYPPTNRPPYPVDDSNFPMPVLPGSSNLEQRPRMPNVHLPSNSHGGHVIPMQMPMPVPSPRTYAERNAPSAPLAEEQSLLDPQDNGAAFPVAPPSYEEATRNKNIRK